jgi:hypothetical protein
MLRKGMQESNTKLKIITYIDRVNVLSDIFIKYYTKFFKHEEFYFLILKNNYNEVSNYLKNKNFLESSFEMVYNDHIGIPKIIEKQNSIVNYFVNNNYLVVYVDIDEIVYHHDLRKYLEIVHCNIAPKGIVIIPDANEKIIDKNLGILSQRSNCVFDDIYHSKICILKSNFTWSGGRHNKNSTKISDDIFLIDVSKCCLNIMIENNKISNSLYPNGTERYFSTKIDENENILNNWRKHITKIPNYILEKNLF